MRTPTYASVFFVASLTVSGCDDSKKDPPPAAASAPTTTKTDVGAARSPKEPVSAPKNADTPPAKVAADPGAAPKAALAPKAVPAPAPTEPVASDPDAVEPVTGMHLETGRPIAVAEPPWSYSVRSAVPIKQGPQPKLKQLSKKRNAVVDTDRWLLEHGFALPTWVLPTPHGGPATLPAEVATTYGSDKLLLAIDHAEHGVFVYGGGYPQGRYLAVTDRSFSVQSFLDFAQWEYAPATAAGAGSYVQQRVTWADVSDGVLFVAFGHNTYAKSSGGNNAYISALDLTSGDLLWRSDPLVSNGRNFVLREGWIIAGYGFTAEDDFLHIIDTRDGSTARSVKVKSGPELLFVKDDQLYVRTYDTDYVFSL